MSTGATASDTWRLGRRPALDGVRGVAVLLVVFCHFVDRDRFLGLGSAGVTLFFVLSGFLITALLLEEHGRTGRIKLADFYRRRMLRLLPALALVVLVVTTVRVLFGSAPNALKDAAAILFYYGNWASISDRLLPLQHTWSLAVEEQFYVVWPVILIAALAAGGRRLLTWVALLGVVASAGSRLMLHLSGSGWDRIYLGTDTRADGLLVGALLALYLSSRPEVSRRRRVATVALGCAVGVGLLTDPTLLYLWAPLIVAVLGAAVIWCLAQGDGATWLTNRFLVLLGQRSYGVYLWNGPVYYSVYPLGLPWWVGIPLMCLLNVGFAAMSWRYVEEPFLRLKHRPAVVVDAQTTRTPLSRAAQDGAPA